MAEQYAGWEIEATVMSDELGDETDIDAAATYDAFCREYEAAIEAEFPGALASVTQSSNGGIRSASERPQIKAPGLEYGEDYEECCARIQAIGEEVFEHGTFWREKEPEETEV